MCKLRISFECFCIMNAWNANCVWDQSMCERKRGVFKKVRQIKLQFKTMVIVDVFSFRACDSQFNWFFFVAVKHFQVITRDRRFQSIQWLKKSIVQTTQLSYEFCESKYQMWITICRDIDKTKTPQKSIKRR